MNDVNTATIEYYNQNARAFQLDTVSAQMQSFHDVFLSYLPQKATILDFGCGSGRDTKCFLEKGHIVRACDGSRQMCAVASAYTGVDVKRMLFQELEDVDSYDGIWACASILHLEKDALMDVFHRMNRALKSDGVIYTSFKYGTFEGFRGGRYYSDFNENTFQEMLKTVPTLTVEKYWITSDVRKDREEEKWLNLILRKVNIH